VVGVREEERIGAMEITEVVVVVVDLEEVEEITAITLSSSTINRITVLTNNQLLLILMRTTTMALTMLETIATRPMPPWTERPRNTTNLVLLRSILDTTLLLELISAKVRPTILTPLPSLHRTHYPEHSFCNHPLPPVGRRCLLHRSRLLL
jgi:hypothetical protein